MTILQECCGGNFQRNVITIHGCIDQSSNKDQHQKSQPQKLSARSNSSHTSHEIDPREWKYEEALLCGWMSKDWSRHRTGTDAWDFLHTFLINKSVMLKAASHEWCNKPVTLTPLLCGEKEGEKRTKQWWMTVVFHTSSESHGSFWLNHAFSNSHISHRCLNSQHWTFHPQTRDPSSSIKGIHRYRAWFTYIEITCAFDTLKQQLQPTQCDTFFMWSKYWRVLLKMIKFITEFKSAIWERGTKDQLGYSQNWQWWLIWPAMFCTPM